MVTQNGVRGIGVVEYWSFVVPSLHYSLLHRSIAPIVLVYRLTYNDDIVAFKMGRQQGGPSRTGVWTAHI
jgi:hypothetical protein